MKQINKHEISILKLFGQFIKESKSGRRLKKNGKRLQPGSIKNYETVLKLLEEFDNLNNYQIRIRIIKKYSKTLVQSELNYWKRFYRRFTDFLYKKKGHHDNYVGFCIKIIHTFFNYLKNDKGMLLFDIRKNFYVHNEIKPVLVLDHIRLNFLIHNKEFDRSLPIHLRRIKDILVFGCTVGLRYSDLRAIDKTNLQIMAGKTYLVVRSQKTNTETKILLPQHAVDILDKYKLYARRKKKLIPTVSLFNFNKYAKQLCKSAGWDEQILIHRSIRGQYKRTGKKYVPFYNTVSSHIMRRTAITTLLMMGMPEIMVRKISGHAETSKSFHRYVNFAQSFQDEATEKAFNKLKMM